VRRGINGENGNAAALAAADFLHLAAAPTFAIMALLTGVLGGGSPDVLCSAASAAPLSGMVPMYVLMSAFHSAPWLKLISRRRSGVSQRVCDYPTGKSLPDYQNPLSSPSRKNIPLNPSGKSVI
jgi:hypothetical protein